MRKYLDLVLRIAGDLHEGSGRYQASTGPHVVVVRVGGPVLAGGASVWDVTHNSS